MAAYLWVMRRRLFQIALCCLLAAPLAAAAASGRIIKVLPHFLDAKGRHALSPSLYDRDAYQAYLRVHPKLRSGMRFDVQWKARGLAAPLKLRVELIGTARGDLPARLVLEYDVKAGGWFSHWTSLPLTGEEYRKLGNLTGWRATLWQGDRLLGEQKSFLWSAAP
jgi:hypothetical protein